MTVMAQLDGLHEQILRQLAEGRCTPRYLASEVEQSRQLVSSRLQDLQMGEYVTKIDRGLYEITEKGRREVSVVSRNRSER
jgi:Mn-dependent DtxR family transcriptional regulator